MDIKRLFDTLEQTGILRAVEAVLRAEKTDCYLVGGAVRDAIMGHELADFDFCLPSDPGRVAEQIAERLGATWFVLDAARGHSRFVLRHEEKKISCDFAPFRAPSLDSDLRKRDFTINAIALNCLQPDSGPIDPLHGRDDLSRRILRVCSEYSFLDDPLRCLKGIRHAACLGFEIEPKTRELLLDAIDQIDQIAPERVRTELAKAIGCGQPAGTFSLLTATGLIGELFGRPRGDFDGAAAVLTRLESTLRTLRMGSCSRIVRNYLEGECEEYVTNHVALTLAVFLHRYQPVALKSVLHALRFSKRTIGLIGQLMSLDEQTLDRMPGREAGPRSRARWLSTLGPDPFAAAIFSAVVSDRPVGEALLQVELLIDAHESCARNGKLTELVDGTWIARELGVPEGPAMGEIFERLHRAEIEGTVSNPEEARKWLRQNQKVIDNDFPPNL